MSVTAAPPAKQAGSGAGSRVPGVLGLTALTLALAGIVAGSLVIPDHKVEAPPAQPLPISLAAPELACPGSETLATPDGGTPVAAPGPVWVSALAGSSHGLAVAGVQAYGKGSQLAVDAAGESRTSDRLRITARNVPARTGALALGKLGPVVIASQAGSKGAENADRTPSLAGMQSTLARFGDLRGLVAATCSVPAASSWLVGGGTKDGERLRLLLSNPLATPAVADLEVHGPDGLVDAPSGGNVVVPPRQTSVVYIDALTQGLSRVAVHVSARSGRVVATMHDNLLRGLAPGGTDDIQSSANPAVRQVIPGVALTDGYSKTAGDPDAAGSTSVRIAVPGTEEAVARVRLVDGSGTVSLPRGAVVNVPAGGVADVPIAGVPSKTYTAIVESDVPVVASARIGRSDPAAAPAAAEFGWASSATTISGDGYAVLPRGATCALSLAAPESAATVRVREVDDDGHLGEIQTIRLDGGSSLAVRLSGDAVAVRIEHGTGDGGPVGAALVATADDDRGPLITVPQIRITPAAQPRPSAVNDPGLGS